MAKHMVWPAPPVAVAVADGEVIDSGEAAAVRSTPLSASSAVALGSKICSLKHC